MSRDIAILAELSFKSLQKIAINSIKNNNSFYKSGQGKIFAATFLDVVKMLAKKNNSTLLISKNSEQIFDFNKISREKLLAELQQTLSYSIEICEKFLERVEAKIKNKTLSGNRLKIEGLGNVALIAGRWRLFL